MPSTSAQPFRITVRQPRRSSLMGRILRLFLAAAAAAYAFWIAALLLLKVADPPTTGVQIQRRVESWLQKKPYRKRYTFVPLSRISPDLQHAVLASEDPNFYKHHGFEWGQIQKVLEESAESGAIKRGASTISQQLIKNLFFTTHRNYLRKAIEYTLVPPAELILGKRRILELYLNVIEWGPGVWGAQAAAEYHYHTAAANLDREQSARLAACLPAPRRRRPERMNQFSALIQERMRQLGW
jgi:monofunctional biosynthetic peptidoglycan transglycosylase